MKEKESLIGIIIGTLLFLWIVSGFDYEETFNISTNIDDTKTIRCFSEEDTDFFKVTVTKYNPVSEQCDSDPLITADGSFIDTLQLKQGNLKWIAISRDLRQYFNYGDTVIIESSCGEIDGEYVVRDTMNPRWSNRVDLLSPCGDYLGMWHDVFIYKK